MSMQNQRNEITLKYDQLLDLCTKNNLTPPKDSQLSADTKQSGHKKIIDEYKSKLQKAQIESEKKT
jgi:hypothetical protein